jgi:YD repeat-containing protein
VIPFSLCAQSGVQYVYDALGRLIGVIDASGNAAAYSYDAVGNITAITRYTNSQVSILQFTPTSGPIGTTVTIYGTGFSSNPSQDTASFNGVTASIISATQNQLVTTVPTGATTGTLSVTSPNGSFTSTQQFTVGVPVGVPTISGFTPPSGLAGNTVTVSGNNFDTVTANDRARINATAALVSSASATQLSISVPASTGSGHITVATPSGTAVSTQDFYIPFGTHLASAIGFAGRINPGGTQTISLSGQIGLLLFDATAGGEATLQLSNSTFSSCTIYIFAPNTAQLSSTPCSSSIVGALPLPMSGTYTIGVDPGTNSGTITIGLNSTPGASPFPSRPTGSMIDYSNPLSTNLVGLFVMNENSGTADENLPDTQTASFSGTTPPTWSSGEPSIAFNGGSSLNSYLNAGTDLIFDQLPVSQMTIVAKVFVSALSAGGVAEKNDNNATDSGFVFGWDGSGALHLAVEKSSADMRIISANGVITAGQWVQVAFTWDGTVGTAAAAHLFVNGVEQTKTSSTDGSGTLGYVHATNQPFRIGNASFDPEAGSLNGKVAYLAVYKGRILTNTEISELDTELPIENTNVNGSISENASPIQVTTTSPGQSAQFLLNGNVEQQSKVQISNNTIGSLTVSLLNADGTTLSSASSSSANFTLPTADLPNTNLYRVYVHPSGATTGNVSLAVSAQGGPGTIPSRPTSSALNTSNALSTDLVGLFLMNESSGTTDENLVDSQTASFSGTQSPTWNTSDPSVVFNGGASLNSYLNAGTDSIFDQLPTNQVTVVAKVYVNTLAAGGVAEKNDGNTTDSGFVFGWDSSGALHLTFEKSTLNMRAVSANGAIAAGQWIQVAFTWDGTVGTSSAAHLFVNGVEQTKVTAVDGSGTLGYVHAVGKPFRIGNASFDTATGSMNGKMAYLAVYKGRILTPTEMSQLDAILPIQ